MNIISCATSYNWGEIEDSANVASGADNYANWEQLLLIELRPSGELLSC